MSDVEYLTCHDGGVYCYGFLDDGSLDLYRYYPPDFDGGADLYVHESWLV